MNREMDPVPEGSIYLWMYKQGLKHIDYNEICSALMLAGKKIRNKDDKNYWNGWTNSDLKSGGYENKIHLGSSSISNAKNNMFKMLDYSEYPVHPYKDIPWDIDERWVPCNSMNKPIIKWGQGCMTLDNAKAIRGCTYLAENLLGTKQIVIDIDGDHDPDNIDHGVINAMYGLRYITHTLSKPYMNDNGKHESYHLTFSVDRVIPTMHFPEAHIDIIGNRANSLRYFKNKIYNGLPPIPMDDDTWDYIKEYILRRKELYGNGNGLDQC